MSPQGRGYPSGPYTAPNLPPWMNNVVPTWMPRPDVDNQQVSVNGGIFSRLKNAFRRSQQTANDPNAMSDWFITHMRGEGQLDQYGDVVMNGAFSRPPVSLTTAAGEWDYSKVRKDIPNFAQHGRNDFTGDWARRASNGTFYRPTSMNNIR